MSTTNVFPMTPLPAPGVCSNSCPPWLGPQGDSVTCVPRDPGILGVPMCGVFVGTGAPLDIEIGYDPDLIWWKNQELLDDWMLQTIEQPIDYLFQPNGNSPRIVRSNYVTSFILLPNGGFSLGDGSNIGYPEGNLLNNNYSFWAFKKSFGFFDSGVYTGTGSAQFVGHNLGVVPELIICKTVTSVGNWFVYHKDLGNDGVVVMSSNVAAVQSTTYWNSTDPTDIAFGVGNDNDTPDDHIFLMFATKPGVSLVGSYISDGSTVIIPTDFVPSQILIKNVSAVSDWQWVDITLNPTNPATFRLVPNSLAAGTSPGDIGNFQTTQVEITITDLEYNNPGDTYIYLLTGY